MTGPAWLDPRYMSEAKLRQLAAHEETIRERERARARRRLQALMPTAETKWCKHEVDFAGCTL